MDPVTQGAVGAAFAASIASRPRTVLAVALGALSGMAPDLDVLIQSPTDPLLFLEYHRQFTHSLMFIPLGALLCAAVAHPVARRWQAFRTTYLFCLFGYGSHGLLDACTSYGTQLLWPFSDTRIAWNWVSVVDPLFSLPVLLILAVAVLRRRPQLAVLAMGWAVVYLSLGALQHGRAHHAAMDLAHDRGHRPEQISVKPSFGNLLVWKTIYAFEGWFYVDAVHLGRHRHVFVGERALRLDIDQALPWLVPGTTQADDVARFVRFSKGFVAVERSEPNRIIDVRYSLVPNEIDPLWGLRLEPGAPPDQHASFFTNRYAAEADRQALWRMITCDACPTR